MHRAAFTGILCALTLGAPAMATEELPPAQTIAFYLHQTPNDPESPVVHAVVLDLQALERSGDLVGWRIDQLTLRRFAGDGTEPVWDVALPVVPSSDGLWWVAHVDPLAPLRDEFGLMPWLLGRATSRDARYSDMDFDLVGNQYVPPQGGAPYEATASLSYALVATNPQDPVDDSEEDEPVEMPRPINTPY